MTATPGARPDVDMLVVAAFLDGGIQAIPFGPGAGRGLDIVELWGDPYKGAFSSARPPLPPVVVVDPRRYSTASADPPGRPPPPSLAKFFGSPVAPVSGF